jgi:valyl-tRNA synthetase
MAKELPKAYDFNETESKLYQWWWDQGYFEPSNDPNKPGFDPERDR